MPDHYFRLRPFLRLFETGLPILLYHKMGKAQLLARRKGLFVTRDLLSRQLAELTAEFGVDGSETNTYRLRRILAYCSLQEFLGSNIPFRPK